MTEGEIRNLAKEIYRGEVFTSYNSGVTQSLLPKIFMPLVFLTQEARQKMIDGDVDMLYAPMRKAGPTAVNGMPQFFEFQWCSKDDTSRVLEMVEKIRMAVEEASE